MPTFKCKMCGGDLLPSADSKTCECEFCGTRQTVPSAGNEKLVNLFNRANRLRMSSDFDKAGSIYEQILAEFPEEAEAYWGLCLCNYGIEYVDDPATARKIPTVHRASFEKLRKDENYELALEYADASARSLYQEEAKEIDRIMGEILRISQNEQPYDLFICYKETDLNGGRTPDSVLAQDIYDALTARGYKVFFSRITLEDKLGTQYEPYIFAALNSARILLAVGTDYDYFNAVWVRNERSRFLMLMAKDKTKVLIPCYRDMDAYDLPDEFKGLQAQDLSKLGWLQDLTRGVDKLMGRAETGTETREEPPQPATVDTASVELYLKRANTFLENEKWDEAESYGQKVLDIDPRNARAYLVKLMAELNVKNKEFLKKYSKPFSKSENYKSYLRFADEDSGAELIAINSSITYRNEQARLKKTYESAVYAISDPQVTSTILIQQADVFESLKDYRDSKELAAQCMQKAKCIQNDAYLDEARLAEKDAETAAWNGEYVSAAESFQEAASYYEKIPGWKDADEKLRYCQKQAEKQIQRKSFSEGMSAFGKTIVAILFGIIVFLIASFFIQMYI